jgi:hypothetical protein
MSRSQQRKLKKKTHKDHRKPEDLCPLEKICEWMSYIFHEQCLSPDYQIVLYSNHGREWGTVPMDGPIKIFEEFFKVRIGHYFKRNLYNKAQRAHQDELISQLLGNLIYHRIQTHTSLDPLTYQNKEIRRVFIQNVTVTGHKTHRLDEMEYLVPTKHKFEILKLEDQDGKPIYIDLCGPQVDICVYGTNGKPFLILDSGKALQVNQPYSPEHKPYIKILELGESREITGDEMWNDYQDNLIRNSVNIYDFSTRAKGLKTKENKTKNKNNSNENDDDSSSSSEENSYEEEKHQELMEVIEKMRNFMNEKIYPKEEK